MIIVKTKQYTKDFNKKLLNKHLLQEINRVNNVENFLILAKNMQEAFNSPYKAVYYLEQKKGDLKEFFTVRINSKIRLIIKPDNTYPYDYSKIENIIFEEIDDSHYGEG